MVAWYPEASPFFVSWWWRWHAALFGVATADDDDATPFVSIFILYPGKPCAGHADLLEGFWRARATSATTLRIRMWDVKWWWELGWNRGGNWSWGRTWGPPIYAAAVVRHGNASLGSHGAHG
jgi:hypothetical protein